MKIRIAFVANSSSASFTVALDSITEKQKQLIYDYATEYINYTSEIYPWDDGLGGVSGWDITEEDGFISGWTLMNNFDMGLYLKEIGVPDFVYEVDH